MKVAVGSQQSLRLVDQALRVGIAGLEEKLRGDHPGPRSPVEAIGEPEESPVLLRVAGVENVFDHDVDVADRGPFRDRHRRIQQLEEQ